MQLTDPERFYRVGIIGCGRMAHGHARAYQEIDGMRLIACADVSPEAVERYRDTYHILNGYADYRHMLEKERLDIVSIVTWPPLHADMVCLAAEAGVRGILCEKPMTLSLDDADRMLETCRRTGTVLVVNHQRRWSAQYETARRFIEEGSIGDLIQMEASHFGSDLLTDATHIIDLFRFYNGDRRVEWVFAQVTAQERTRYGHPVEDTALVYFKFANEVRALLTTGRIPIPSFEEGSPVGPRMAYCSARLIGTEGVLEVAGDRHESPPLLYLMNGDCAGWRAIVPRSTSKRSPIARSVERLAECIEDGTTDHRNEGGHARANLEVILASFVSARRRMPVLLPLDERGFTYEALLASGSS